MKTFVIIIAVLSLLLFSGEGYLILSERTEIKNLQAKIQLFTAQQKSQSSQIASIKKIQKRTESREKILFENEQKIVAVVNGIMDKLSESVEPSKLDKAE